MKYDISKPSTPKMPSLGKRTESIKILLSQANFVAQNSDNKGHLTTLAEAIYYDFRQHDEVELKKLVEWQKQKQSKGANKDKSERPNVWEFR